MKNELHTVPILDAFRAGDECPFCFAERELEHKAIDFTVGVSSYMAPEIRVLTNKRGFCGHHMKMMYQYGNTIGNALILQSYMEIMREELAEHAGSYVPAPRNLLTKYKKVRPEDASDTVKWLKEKRSTCFVCEKIHSAYDRYLDTFFSMLKEPEFRQLVEEGKGFCMRHFTDLLEKSETQVPAHLVDWFYPTVFRLMEQNLQRVQEDIDWFVTMFDYRNGGQDWKNSRDAVPRAMQKINGLYPADPVYKKKD